MARTKAADYEQKREAILRSAARLFAEVGFDRCSMSQLAEACGVSKALLYHYYSGKDALLYDVIGAHLTALCSRVETVQGQEREPEVQLNRLVSALLDALVAVLPESPSLYPEDELSDRPLRFLAAELVREAAFETLAQELPYSLAVEVVDFDESRTDLVRIRANLLVERASQKQIVIGRGGEVVKKIGVRARREIEKLVGGKVHLELWVKVEPKWSKRPGRLKSLGYS